MGALTFLCFFFNIFMYRLWLQGLYGLYWPHCQLSPERPLNLIIHSLTFKVQFFWLLMNQYDVLVIRCRHPRCPTWSDESFHKLIHKCLSCLVLSCVKPRHQQGFLPQRCMLCVVGRILTLIEMCLVVNHSHALNLYDTSAFVTLGHLHVTLILSTPNNSCLLNCQIQVINSAASC